MPKNPKWKARCNYCEHWVRTWATMAASSSYNENETYVLCSRKVHGGPYYEDKTVTQFYCRSCTDFKPKDPMEYILYLARKNKAKRRSHER